MDTALLIQAASNIAGAMAGALYGQYNGLESSRITDIAAIAVKITRAIEAEVIKQP